MSKLTYWEGYLAMFHFLDKLYERTQIDDLGGLASTIDPFLFEGDLPMDTSMVVDWLGIIKKDNLVKEDVTIEECFSCMIAFLEKEQQEFNYKLDSIIQELRDTISNPDNCQTWSDWLDSVGKVLNS